MSSESGVDVRETGRGKFQVQISVGATTFIGDEPLEVGGLGSGPSPYDLLAASLGACTAMTIRLYAGRKNWPLRTTAVRARHRRDPITGADEFVREILLDGDLTPEQRSRIIEIASRCPVHRTLERGSTIRTMLVDTPFGDALVGSREHIDAMQAASAD